MRVHHLNCGTLCPVSRRLVNGEGGLFEPARMVCHCLLVESPDGLVLIDTGMGTADVADVRGRLGGWFASLARPIPDRAATALEQVRALGFSPGDVRHIVPTHLDLDHAGGLPDFPQATVHLFEPEHEAAMRRATRAERRRYRPVQWAHGPRWDLLRTGGQRWMGFEAVRAIAPLGDDLLVVPLVGHTRGHAGVAVRTAAGWLLHAGDAYFCGSEIDPVRPRCPPGLALFQRLVALDDRARRENRERLRNLARQGEGGAVRVFCAHCPRELAALAAAAPAAATRPAAAPLGAAGRS